MYGTMYATLGFRPCDGFQEDSFSSRRSGLIPSPSIGIPTMFILCGLTHQPDFAGKNAPAGVDGTCVRIILHYYGIASAEKGSYAGFEGKSIPN